VAGVRLQSQVNNPGVGITTNWFDVQGVAGTNHVVVPINSTDGSVFYRLALP
jgi:hypothetical protein